MAHASRHADPSLRAEDVIQEIEDLRDRVRAAYVQGEEAGRAARAAYGPCLSRRLQLLAALRDGRATAWRDYPPGPDASRGPGWDQPLTTRRGATS